MPDRPANRGIPLPSLGQICTLAAVAVAMWTLWSEFHRNQPAVNAPGEHDTGGRLPSMLDAIRTGKISLDELTALLHSDDRDTRRNALLTLREAGEPGAEALAAVRERFSDDDPSVRAAALAAFARICDDPDQIRSAAASFLADPDTNVREFAARMLQTAGPTAIPALIAVTHSESAIARQLVIRLLSEADKHRPPDEVNAALRSLFDDPDETVRLQAIKAAVGRGAASVDEIGGWLREENPGVVAEGLRAVMSLGPEAAASILPHLEALLEQGGKMDPRALLSAISHFKSASRTLIPAVMRRFPKPSFQVAQTLTDIGADPADVVPILIPLLVSEGQASNDCWEAGQLLAQIDPAEARRQVSRLIGKVTAKENEPMEAQDSDLNALAGLGSQAQEAVPLLIRLLSHSSRSVRGHAMSALYRLGPDAAPAVRTLLSLVDQDYFAINTLGAIGPPAQSAVPKLLKLIDDPSKGADAAKALGRIGDGSPEVLVALRRQLMKPRGGKQDPILPRLRVESIQSLVLLAGDSPTTLADLLPLLDDNDPTVRAAAIGAIGRLSCDRQEVIDRLIESLADETASIRTATALALGQIGPDAKAALPALRDIASDRRNAVARSSYAWPDEKKPRAVSLTEAAQWAISAIESPAP